MLKNQHVFELVVVFGLKFSAKYEVIFKLFDYDFTY